jgi:Leu/Phe-tRNA-protein transferase
MVPVLNPGDPFPPTITALKNPDGLLAMGGDLSTDTLIRAYRSGIFPWFTEGQADTMVVTQSQINTLSKKFKNLPLTAKNITKKYISRHDK